MTGDEMGEIFEYKGSLREYFPSCHWASLALLFLDVLKINHAAKEKTLNKYLKSGLAYAKREEFHLGHKRHAGEPHELLERGARGSVPGLFSRPS